MRSINPFSFSRELLYNRDMKNLLYRILFVVCLCIFGYSAFQLFTIFQDKNEIKTETNTYEKMVEKEKTLQPDWDALKAENEALKAANDAQQTQIDNLNARMDEVMSKIDSL